MVNSHIKVADRNIGDRREHTDARAKRLINHFYSFVNELALSILKLYWDCYQVTFAFARPAIASLDILLLWLTSLTVQLILIKADALNLFFGCLECNRNHTSY